MKTKVKSEIKTDLKDINKALNALKANCFVKIGILGDKDKREKAVSNSEIGIVHEFGSFTKNIPARSFLRMPLIEKKKELLNALMKYKKLFEKEIAKGNIFILFERLGLAAENIIQLAFETSGFGKWRKLKNRKGTPLVDTGQLRRAITSKVVKGGK